MFSFADINAIFKGEANVKWSEQEFETYSGVTRKKEVNYVGNEVYFEQTHCIYGGDGGNFLTYLSVWYYLLCKLRQSCNNSIVTIQLYLTIMLIRFTQ